LNRKDGTVECIPTQTDNWDRHLDGDDIAVFQLRTEFEKLKIYSLGIDEFVTPQRILDEDIGIGDDTVMIGRFVTHEGKQKNSPAVRFGIIAMMADEKIVTDAGIAQESFLVEMRSLPGYSGSAVLIYSPCAQHDMSQRRRGLERTGIPKTDKFTMPPESYFASLEPKGPFLLGIDFCHLRRKTMVRERNGEKVEDGWYVDENTGMAGVIPAWKIAEVLNREDIIAMRDKEDREFTESKNKSGVSLDYAEGPQKTQTTVQGVEIPILATDQFFADLEKASRKKD
jgi:hypothetical protein